MRRSQTQAMALAAAMLLASCVGIRTAHHANAAPLIYAPTTFPYMTVPEARVYVHEQLMQWRTGRGPIKNVHVNVFSIDLMDGRGHVSTLILDNVEMADVVNHAMEVGDVTLFGGKSIQSEDVRKLADALKFLKFIAPYELQTVGAP